jgi:hypothetical protein
MGRRRAEVVRYELLGAGFPEEYVLLFEPVQAKQNPKVLGTLLRSASSFRSSPQKQKPH